ncbi:MAG: acetyl hydrolase [Rhizobacter sp.]|nr:acetyl hydrolase [Rhizobacter sp.]
MLHPQTKALLDLIEQRGLPPTHTLSVEEARRGYRERRFFTQPDPSEVAEVLDLSADSAAGPIDMRLYKPLSSAGDDTGLLPVLVYFHGGGWTIGDLDTHDVLCRELCNGSGCAVVSVDYRMGPEHVFPAAVDDCLSATCWVHQHGESLGLDTTRIAVGGDSAGGNLAATVSLLARDAGNLPIAYQLLIYPATDMRATLPSHTSNGQGYLLTSDSIRYFHDNYIADPQHDADWRASPLMAADHSGLPPALVLTAGFDPLRDEGLAYANKLSEAGSIASYVCFERQIHGFITMGRVIDEANSAVAFCAAEVRRALKPGTGT